MDTWFRELYQKLVDHEMPFFAVPAKHQENCVQIHNGFDSFLYNIWQLELIPGSFNPLHDGHKAIYESIPQGGYGRYCAFEISLERVGKSLLEIEELWDRVKQFEGYAPVIITTLPLYVQKAGLFESYCEVKFHIGFDNANLILDTWGKYGVQGINADFFVYPRRDKKLENIDLKNRPRNFRKGAFTRKVDLYLSSTGIREKL